jgi:hypothetical protein
VAVGCRRFLVKPLPLAMSFEFLFGNRFAVNFVGAVGQAQRA